jgi:hypothetical protein
MDHETLYHLSCSAARDLLDRLERGKFDQVGEKAAVIRHYLVLAERAPAGALRGRAYYRREQLEAIAGLAETLASAAAALRVKLAGEVQGLHAKRSLLQHLISGPIPSLQSQAAGCISPAAPSA